MARAGDEPRYEYVRVTRDFPAQLVQDLQNHESVVLVGPRYIGKRHVVAGVKHLLAEAGEEFVVELSLMDKSIRRKADLDALLVGQLSEKLGKLGWTKPPDTDDLSMWLQRFLAQKPCHVFALICDVDSLADFLARRLLKMTRDLALAPKELPGRFTAILTGSVGLGPLVYGADSDFTCARYLYVQGYDLDAFGKYADTLLATAGWTFDAPEQCTRCLYNSCGGNVYMLRIMFWALMEGRRVRGVGPQTAVTCQEMNGASRYLFSPASTPIDFVIQAFSRIEDSPEACDAVAHLVQEGKAALPKLASGELVNTPTEVETSGLAIRSHDQLVFASPLIEQIARYHFTDWKMGDYFACSQEWGPAFAHYERAISLGAHWFYSPTDRGQLSSAIRAFEVALHAKAPEGPEELDAFFVQGAKYLLGFDEISYWRYKEKWELLPRQGTGAQLSENVRMTCLSLLPSRIVLRTGLNPLDVAFAPYALVVGLSHSDIEVDLAVILSNFDKEVPLTRERLRLCESVITTYCAASGEARRISHASKEAEALQYLLETVPLTLDALTARPAETLVALETAASRLRRIGYKRIMFAMVDAARSHIKGMLDSRPEGEPDVAAMTDWPLDGPIRDVQQYCVRTGDVVEIEDASKHPLANQKVVKSAGMRGGVIVPIRHGGEVIGTIHCERDDCRCPSKEEIFRLIRFADHFGNVLAVGQQLRMLEASTHAFLDPLLIVDRRIRIRYVNTHAAQDVHLAEGWQKPEILDDTVQRLFGVSRTVVELCIQTKHPVLRYVRAKREEVQYKYLTLFAAPVYDSFGETFGVVLIAHDLTPIRSQMETVKAMAACPEESLLIETLFGATRAMGHEGGRLYRIDPATDRLIGYKQYGFPEGSEGALKFEQGDAVLRGNCGTGHHSWKCFERGRPTLFCFDPKHQDGEWCYTKTGLKVWNVSAPDCPEFLCKPPGWVWLDLPIFCRTSGRALGKLTLDCSQEFAPDAFESLNVLAEVASALLAGLEQRENLAKQQAVWREGLLQKAAREKAISVTSHHLLGRLAALGVLRSRYEKAGTAFDRLTELNREFDALLLSLSQELEHIKERLSPVPCTVECLDLTATVKQLMRRLAPEETIHIVEPDSRILVEADPRLLEKILEELTQNARKAIGLERHPTISINIKMGESAASRHVMLEFSDDGPGIRPEISDRVFDDLYSEWQGGTRGTGLGLGYVRRVMELQGGTIDIADSGSGARFVLAFRAAGGEQR